MGQYHSLLQNTQVINVKKQAAATDLLDTAVWYYDPDSGRNLWGNRAALELYGLSLQAFCSEQKKLWQDALGTAAGDEWQISNDWLAQQTKSVEADQAKPTYITTRSRSQNGGNLSDLGAQAGLLPPPKGVLQLSAHARPCTVVCKKQPSRAYQVHVTAVQRTGTGLDQGSLTSAGKEAAVLQSPQHLNCQPETIAAGGLQQHSSNSSDGVLLDIPEGSAQVTTYAIRRQSTITSTSPTAYQGRRLGATNNSSSYSSAPAGTALRLPSRSLDLSPQAVAQILRHGQVPSARASTGLRASSGGTVFADSSQPLPLPRDTGSSIGMFQPMRLEDQLQRQQRLVEMCDNHAMFHFLFDADGRLLTANKRALNNMREHLGDHEIYTLSQYLAIGQCDGGLSADEVFDAIRIAIIVNQEPCVRLPQLRWSKRQTGKFRWVLYEIWPLEDPVSKQPALLVTEQNITQVKAVEEEYSNQMRHLETQLEEALLQQQQAEAAAAEAEAAAAAAAAAVAASHRMAAHQLPAFDTSSAAEKTLQLLDKLLNGDVVSIDDAEALRSAIVEGGSSLHAPVFLDEQVLQQTEMYAPEVGASLLQMLSTRAPWDVGKDPLPDVAENDGSGGDTPPKSPRSSHNTSATTSGGGSSSPVFRRSESVAHRLAQVAIAEPAPVSQNVSAPLPTVSAPLPYTLILPAPAADPAALPSGNDRSRRVSVTMTSVTAYPTLLQSDVGLRRPSNSSAVTANGGTFGSGSPFGRGAVAAAAKDVMSLVSVPSTELDSILAQVDNWQFDSFALSAATSGRPLSTLGFFLLQRSGIVKKLSLDENRLARWLVRVEDGYRANPYHNKIHAADVLRTSHVLLTRGGCGGAPAPDDLTQLAVYLAAIVHDYEHRGVTNDFLVRIGDALALLYNDRSPHENHHLAASWALLAEYNFMRGQPVASKEQLRRMVIEMVLATDMKQHFSVHGLFQSKIHLLIAAGHLPPRRSGTTTPGTGLSSGGLDPLSRATSAGATTAVAVSKSRTPNLSASSSRQQVLAPGPTTAGEAPSATQSASLSGDAETSNTAVAAGESSSSSAAALPSPAAGNSFSFKRLRRTSSIVRRTGAAGEPAGWEEDADTRSLYLQMCLKAADLGHLSAARPVHRKWVEALEEENFRQGDREKAVGLNISPLMDRTRAGITKSQVGFFDIVALPLFRSIAQRFSNATPILEGVLDNYHMWKEIEEPTNVAAQ